MKLSGLLWPFVFSSLIFICPGKAISKGGEKMFRRKIVVNHEKVSGSDLKNFPVLISLSDDNLKSVKNGGHVEHLDGEDIFFTSSDGRTKIDYEIEKYDPATGELKAWVKIPLLSYSKDTNLYLYYGDTSGGKFPRRKSRVWDSSYQIVLHREAISKNYRVSSSELNISKNITVEAWINSKSSQSEKVQTIISQWSPLTDFGVFSAYDAGNTLKLDSKGFLGAVFDGRYVYFVPQANTTLQSSGQRRHGIVLRYDTQGKFKNPESWQAYDASHTSGLITKGFYGGVFDGRYVYFVPRFDGVDYHSRVLRYDTQGEFKDEKSWVAYDVGLPISYQSAGFDGRYIYFAPGSSKDEKISKKIVLRYDTHGNFRDRSSWQTYNCQNTSGLKTEDFDGVVFDGRYIYFVPLTNRAVLRYDTRGSFTDGKNWMAFDATPLMMQSCVGAIFDGKYIYFVPYAHTVVVRYDTEREFSDSFSWASYDAANTNGLKSKGYDGAVFDGRFVYFVPFYDGEGSGPEHFHGIVLRYDATKDFTDKESWSAYDAGNTEGLNTKGYNGAAFDGRYIYFAPWNRGEGEGFNIAGHGTVLRYDTTGKNASFILKYTDCGHNGGLCAAVWGPRFIINTSKGVLSVSMPKVLPPGRHHLAGVYDGKKIRLFVDGVLYKETTTSGGKIQKSKVDIGVGRIVEGLGCFDGVIEEIRISNTPRSVNWIETEYNNLNSPGSFYTLEKEENASCWSGK